MKDSPEKIAEIIPIALKQWGINPDHLAAAALRAEQWEKDHPREGVNSKFRITTGQYEKRRAKPSRAKKYRKQWPTIDTTNLEKPSHMSWRSRTVYTDRGERFWTLAQASALTGYAQRNIEEAAESNGRCKRCGRLWSFQPFHELQPA